MQIRANGNGAFARVFAGALVAWSWGCLGEKSDDGVATSSARSTDATRGGSGGEDSTRGAMGTSAATTSRSTSDDSGRSEGGDTERGTTAAGPVDTGAQTEETGGSSEPAGTSGTTQVPDGASTGDTGWSGVPEGCGAPLQPSPRGPCPSECTSCTDTTCTIVCGPGGRDCPTFRPLVCPAGWNCDVKCQRCHGLDIECPEDGNCAVTCDLCMDGSVKCRGAGRCTLDCMLTSSVLACDDLGFSCADGACAMTCHLPEGEYVDGKHDPGFRCDPNNACCRARCEGFDIRPERP